MAVLAIRTYVEAVRFRNYFFNIVRATLTVQPGVAYGPDDGPA